MSPEDSPNGNGAPTLPLFTTLMNFRHSHEDITGRAGADAAWAGLRSVGGEERTNYPVTVSVDDASIPDA